MTGQPLCMDAREGAVPYRSRPFVGPLRVRSDRQWLLAVIGIILLVAMVPFHPTPAVAGVVSVTGFIKEFFIVQDPARVSVDGREVGLSTMLADNVRTRVNVAAGLSDWLDFDVSYNVVPRVQNDAAALAGAVLFRTSPSTYRVDDLRPTLSPVTPGADDRFVVLQNLDRLLVTVHAEDFDFFLGRQAVAWGAAKAVNPTDVIAPFLFTEIDTEDRIGVDAARVRVPVGALSEIDAGYVGGRNAEWERSAAYVRARTYLGSTDVSTLVMAFRGSNLLVGGDLTRAVWQAGFWCEAALVAHDDDGDGALRPDEVDYGRVSTGFDYSFSNATYTFLEYHYSSAGRSDPADYAGNAGSRAYTDGAVYLLGRHYLIPGVSWPATPLVTVGGSLLVNLNDGSVLAAPTLEYNVLENAYLAAGAFVGFGDNPNLAGGTGATTYTPGTTPDLGAVDFTSEFGAYPDIWFLSARYYF